MISRLFPCSFICRFTFLFDSALTRPGGEPSLALAARIPVSSLLHANTHHSKSGTLGIMKRDRTYATSFHLSAPPTFVHFLFHVLFQCPGCVFPVVRARFAAHESGISRYRVALQPVSPFVGIPSAPICVTVVRGSTMAGYTIPHAPSKVPCTRARVISPRTRREDDRDRTYAISCLFSRLRSFRVPFQCPVYVFSQDSGVVCTRFRGFVSHSQLVFCRVRVPCTPICVFLV